MVVVIAELVVSIVGSAAAVTSTVDIVAFEAFTTPEDVPLPEPDPVPVPLDR